MSNVSNNANIASVGRLSTTLKWSQFASIAKNDMLDNDQKVYFTGKSKSGLCCNVVGEARTFSAKKTLKSDSETMRRMFLNMATQKLGGMDGANAEVIRDIAKKLTGEGTKNSTKLLATPLDKRVISEVVQTVSEITKKGVFNSVKNDEGRPVKVEAQIGAVNETSIKEYKDKLNALATMAKIEAKWDKDNLKKKSGKSFYTHDALVKRCHDFVCAPEFKEYRKAALLVEDNFEIVEDLVEYAKSKKAANASAVTGNEGASKPKRMKAEFISSSCISEVITSDEWNPDGTFTFVNAGDAGRYEGTINSKGFDESVRRASIPTVGGIFFEKGYIKCDDNPESIKLNVCTDERGLGKMHTTNGIFYKCTATNTDSYGKELGGEKSAKAKNYNIVDFAMPSLAMDSAANFDILSCTSWMDKCYNLQQKVEARPLENQDQLKRTPKQIANFKQILAEVRDKVCVSGYNQKTHQYIYPDTHIKELDEPSELATSVPANLTKPKRANDLMLMAIFGGEKFRKLLDLFDGKTEGKAEALINLAKTPEVYLEALQEAVENYKATLKETFTQMYDALIAMGRKQIALPLVGAGYYQNFVTIIVDVISDVAAEKSDKIKTQVINRTQYNKKTKSLDNDPNSDCLKNAIDKKIAKLEEQEKLIEQENQEKSVEQKNQEKLIEQENQEKLVEQKDLEGLLELLEAGDQSRVGGGIEIQPE